MQNKDNKFKEQLQELAKKNKPMNNIKKSDEIDRIKSENLMKKTGDNARMALEIIKDEEGR